MPSGVEHGCSACQVARQRSCDPLRCPRALSTCSTWATTGRCTVRPPSMPSGVEHANDYTLATAPTLVRPPSMPSGVEHKAIVSKTGRGIPVRPPSMPSGVEHSHGLNTRALHRRCDPLRCPRALSTTRWSPSRGRRTVRPPSMPSGVEHNGSGGVGLRRCGVRPPSMPSGVEHVIVQGTPAVFELCDPLRCPRALSTVDDVAGRAAGRRVRPPSMPSGVEHFGFGHSPLTTTHVRPPSMPSGVEHNRKTIVIVLTLLCDPLRCPRALSTRGNPPYCPASAWCDPLRCPRALSTAADAKR